MSVRNGMPTRRAGLVLGGACFLATAVLFASKAEASATLALKPTGTLPAGASVSGSDTTGYTLTLPAGTSASFTYDVIVTISGASPAVDRIQGAVVTSSTGTVVGAHNAYSVGSTYNETTGTFTGTNAASAHTDAVFSLTSASTAGQAFGTKYTFKPGFLATGGTPTGVGPQSGTFSSLVNSGSDPSNSRVQVTYATPVATASLDAMSASVTMTGTAGSTSTLKWADGTGATGTSAGSGTVYQSALEWSEGSSSFFSGVSGASYTQFGLNVTFVTAGPVFALGDFNGDGGLDVSDIDGFVAALSEGDPFSQFITDNDAAFFATYGQHLTTAAVNSIGDFNGDGGFDVSDIDGFVLALSGGSSAPTFAASVPEPTSAALLGLAIPALASRRRRGR